MMFITEAVCWVLLTFIAGLLIGIGFGFWLRQPESETPEPVILRKQMSPGMTLLRFMYPDSHRRREDDENEDEDSTVSDE